eukprot:274815-Prorocentrum_minimum.AAC.1
MEGISQPTEGISQTMEGISQPTQRGFPEPTEGEFAAGTENTAVDEVSFAAYNGHFAAYMGHFTASNGHFAGLQGVRFALSLLHLRFTPGWLARCMIAPL